MTITIDLSPETEARLIEQAQNQGIDTLELARQLIERALPHKNISGAQAFEFWQQSGIIGTFSDRPDSPEFARQIRQQAQERGNKL